MRPRAREAAGNGNKQLSLLSFFITLSLFFSFFFLIRPTPRKLFPNPDLQIQTKHFCFRNEIKYLR